MNALTPEPHAVPEAARRHVAVIGAGAVGTALARRLAACGYPVDAVISRSETPARRLAERIGAPVAATEVAALPDTVDLVCCCVPDDALPSLVEALYLLPRDWAGSTVAHTSGALTTGVLAPLAARGATTLGFHPLQAFTRASPPEAFSGVYVGLEGTPAALAFGQRLAADLGTRPVVVPAGARARYHLAAVLASNCLVTLMALVEEVLAAAGIDRRDGGALMRPLVEGTWRNLAAQPPEAALTGPIARGDEATVAAHLDALGGDLEHLLPVYAALATETVRVAVRGGKLDPDAAQRLLDRLHAALDARNDSLF